MSDHDDCITFEIDNLDPLIPAFSTIRATCSCGNWTEKADRRSAIRARASRHNRFAHRDLYFIDDLPDIPSVSSAAPMVPVTTAPKPPIGQRLPGKP